MFLVRAAIAHAGVDAASIGFVETHGTATPLGDPIEVTALKRVFAGVPQKRVALGSIKTNIGHTIHAAGVVIGAQPLIEVVPLQQKGADA